MQLDLKDSTSKEENLTDYYLMLGTLGKGTYAEVKLAYHFQTEVSVAVKILENVNKTDDNQNSEIQILKLLEHPNIIKLFHIINKKEHTYMVMEHAAWGDVASFIEKLGCLKEQQAHLIFTQLVCAVHYCHEKGIAHRDIKLDNMLIDEKGIIKLCDFGMATRVTSGQMSKGFCGTLEYCAPELFTATEYDAKAVDIWSMGVALYTMLTGCFPFRAKSYSAMKEKVLKPKYYLRRTLSSNIVELIDELFTVMPEHRPTISDIGQHPWLKDIGNLFNILSSSKSYTNNLHPSIVAAMMGMGYHPNDISNSIREQNFNNIMATYRMLIHQSVQDHSIYIEALRALSPPREVRKPVLASFTLPSEHEVSDEKESKKKGGRSLSMPATLCWHQKGDKPPYTVPKCAPKGAYLVSTNQVPKYAPKGTYLVNINQDQKCAPKGTYLVSTNQDQKCAPRGTYLVSTKQVPKCSPEVTHVKSRRLARGSMNSKELSSRSSFTEHISSTQYLSWVAPQEVNTPTICSHTQTKPSVRKYRKSSQGMMTTATYELQKSSFQATSKNNSEGVLPEDVATTSANNLPRGWQRVKKSIGNWMRLLCCCCPVS